MSSIRPVRATDAEAICRIYNHHVLNTIVTFEEEPVAVEDMRGRIEEVLSKDLPWLVLEDQANVVGFAYASTWKSRCAYRYSVESTIYLADSATNAGNGTQLYSALIAQLREARMHTLLGCIALPNEASIALHEKLGFRKVAHFHEVGWKFERWIDVGYWQLRF